MHLHTYDRPDLSWETRETFADRTMCPVPVRVCLAQRGACDIVLTYREAIARRWG